MHEEKPVVLHLACHGFETGSIRIGGKEMQRREFVKDIKIMAKNNKRLRLVILNSCWSGAIAKDLRDEVDFVIGHETAVEDADALAFSKEFYYWLGANVSLQVAAWDARKKCKPCHLLTRTKELAGLKVWMTPNWNISSWNYPNWNISSWADNAPSACSDRDMPSESADHQKLRLMDVMIQAQEDAAPHLSPNKHSSDSETETMSTKSSDEEEENGMELVAARNAGDIQDFKDHISGFINDFCRDFDEYRDFAVKDLDEQNQVIRSTFVSRAQEGEWTLCMLVWLGCVKEARLRERNKKRWSESIKSATEQKLLELFESILLDRTVSHPLWPCKKSQFDELQCDKPYARSVFVTDCLVQKQLKSNNEMIAKQWNEEVIHGWYDSMENHTHMLLRANKFLRRQLDGISILTHVVETGSYVCTLCMPSLTAFLLFAYLEARVGEHKALHGPDSDTRLLFHGFRMFASSRRRIFTLTRADRPSEADLQQLYEKLRMFARLPQIGLRQLGPDHVQTREELERELGRSVLTLHQASRLRECEDAMRTHKGVHLQGPAGTGKTFLALLLILKEMERDHFCTVLFLGKSRALVYFLAKWLLTMAKRRMKDELLYQRLYFSYWKDQEEWVLPFRVTERDGLLEEDEKQVTFLSAQDSEFKFVLIDEAHHVYSDSRAHNFIKERQYERCKVVLTSDSSQATGSEISLPEGLKDVKLSEVVRNSARTMTASLLFNKGISRETVTCHHDFAGRPLKPYIFSAPSGDPLTPQQYVPVIVIALRNLAAEYKGSLHHRAAVLVHEGLLQQGIRQALQPRLDSDPALWKRRLRLVDAVQVSRSMSDTRGGYAEEEIVCDSVDNFDGMESLLVIAAGLDGDQRQDQVEEHRSLLYRAITRAERDGKVAVVNHRIEGLSFLDAIDFTEGFDGNAERSRLGASLATFADSLKPGASRDEERLAPATSARKTQHSPQDSAGQGQHGQTGDQEKKDAWEDLTAQSPIEQAAQVIQSIWDTSKHERAQQQAGLWQPFLPTEAERAGEGELGDVSWRSQSCNDCMKRQLRVTS
eukprot:764899-Hanusia_phi.AAC.2